MPFTWRSCSSIHCDLRTNDVEPSNCLTFVMDACVGFLFVTAKKRPLELVGVQVGLLPLLVVLLSHTYMHMQNERERRKIHTQMCISREWYVCFWWGGINSKDIEVIISTLKQLQYNYNCKGCAVYVFIHSQWVQLNWTTPSTFNGGCKCTITNFRERSIQGWQVPGRGHWERLNFRGSGG